MSTVTSPKNNTNSNQNLIHTTTTDVELAGFSGISAVELLASQGSSSGPGPNVNNDNLNDSNKSLGQSTVKTYTSNIVNNKGPQSQGLLIGTVGNTTVKSKTSYIASKTTQSLSGTGMSQQSTTKSAAGGGLSQNERKSEWYQFLMKKECEVDSLAMQLQGMIERSSDKRHIVRQLKAERLALARELDRVKDDGKPYTGDNLQQVKDKEQQAFDQLEKAKQRKQATLKRLETTRSALGEAQLLQREYGVLLEKLSDDKKSTSKEVGKLHEQLVLLDAVAGELWDVATKENEKRKALKAQIQDAIQQHDEKIASIRRRIEQKEVVEIEKRNLIEAKTSLRTWQAETEKITTDAFQIQTLAQNREAETLELRRQLKSLWGDHQGLLKKIEQRRAQLWNLEAKMRARKRVRAPLGLVPVEKFENWDEMFQRDSDGRNTPEEGQQQQQQGNDNVENQQPGTQTGINVLTDNNLNDLNIDKQYMERPGIHRDYSHLSHSQRGFHLDENYNDNLINSNTNLNYIAPLHDSTHAHVNILGPSATPMPNSCRKPDWRAFAPPSRNVSTLGNGSSLNDSNGPGARNLNNRKGATNTGLKQTQQQALNNNRLSTAKRGRSQSQSRVQQQQATGRDQNSEKQTTSATNSANRNQSSGPNGTTGSKSSSTVQSKDTLTQSTINNNRKTSTQTQQQSTQISNSNSNSRSKSSTRNPPPTEQPWGRGTGRSGRTLKVDIKKNKINGGSLGTKRDQFLNWKEQSVLSAQNAALNSVNTAVIGTNTTVVNSGGPNQYTNNHTMNKSLVTVQTQNQSHLEVTPILPGGTINVNDDEDLDAGNDNGPLNLHDMTAVLNEGGRQVEQAEVAYGW